MKPNLGAAAFVASFLSCALATAAPAVADTRYASPGGSFNAACTASATGSVVRDVKIEGVEHSSSGPR